jgi:tripartite-type tricarboxylate transporter receptor subunit TctC
MSNEIIAIQKLPETAKRFAAEGAEVIMMTPAEMRKMIPVDIEKWKKVAIEANMPRN